MGTEQVMCGGQKGEAGGGGAGRSRYRVKGGAVRGAGVLQKVGHAWTRLGMGD